MHRRFLIGSLLLFGLLVVTTTAILQNSPAEKSKLPVAVVAGKPIFEEELLGEVEGRLRQLRRQEYDLKRAALDNLIEEKLLTAEAAKRSVTVEKLLEEEVEAKLSEPNDIEVEAFYLAQRDRLNRPYEDVKEQLRRALKDIRRRQVREQFFGRLRAEAEVAILLRPPKTKVDPDPARLRGRPDAPVMIVEFSDFQCPYCRSVQPAIMQVLEKYGDRVTLSYRDFPLHEIHPRAGAAAAAARCAGEQRKFWEFHDALFANFGKLDENNLIEFARGLGLNERAFEACLSSGKYTQQVERDLQEGLRAGVNGTPAFFVNGRPIEGMVPPEYFFRIVDEELAAAQPK